MWLKELEGKQRGDCGRLEAKQSSGETDSFECALT